jgi:DNA polymerase type B, organellar and viral
MLMTGNTGEKTMVSSKWDAEYIPDSYIHQKHYKGKGHREGGERGWNVREFIAWDGEGIAHEEPIDEGHGFFREEDSRELFHGHEPKAQPYVLLANSKRERITNRDGLNTYDCFEMLLETKRRYPLSIFVGFGFNYDINQMLRNVPEKILWRLHDNNEASVGSFYIRWRPGKSFYIKHRRTDRSMILYDVLGYFQMSFLKVCEKYLGKDDPRLKTIKVGKDARELFEWSELKDFIIPYCDTELEMLVSIMDIVRNDFHEVGIDPGEWYGPGAVANKVFNAQKVPISRDIPIEVLDASQFAYAGGRFEPFSLGRHPNTVWEYDIHSAYPEATTKLPDLSAGRWEFVKSFEPESFGVWAIDYRAGDGTGDEDNRPQPLFCRSENGSISYPTEVQGYYWSPEANLVPNSVREGWVFRPDADIRPFAFVEGMYDQRRLLQEQGNSLERALKLILNSLYGKLAQTVGAKDDNPPRWHQLEYAGFITSYTRAKIYRAIQQNPDAIIATETDAVFSKEPLDLPLSGALGDWELSEFNEITYLQSGFYYAVANGKIISKYRGMDRDRKTQQPLGLPYRKVLDHLSDYTGKGIPYIKPLSCHTTRFVGLGLGLRTKSVWRSWEKKSRLISLNHRRGYGKRLHIAKECHWCQVEVSMADRLHPTIIGGYSGKSYARALPWRTLGSSGLEAPLDWEEWKEMNTDVMEFTGDIDRWQ